MRCLIRIIRHFLPVPRALLAALPLVLLSVALLAASGALRAAAPPEGPARCDSLAPGDTLRTLRSRFVVPGFFSLCSAEGDTIPDSLYRLETIPGALHLDPSLERAPLVAHYRAWSFLALPESFRLRAPLTLAVDRIATAGDTLTRDTVSSAPFGGSSPGEGFRLAGFEISGSKSVSVSGGGRSGGTALDQNLMLEIGGKLGPETRLSFRLNDQDLPLDPEGRSSELRQLDEIAVSLESPGGTVRLGDYDFRLEGYRFAEIRRKLDGAAGSMTRGPVELEAGAALSGGTFVSRRFQGTEGSQGPYRLTGQAGEPVRVLAGTERVWLDGRPLRRGLANDYVIDYQRCALQFTDRHLIGAESRIEIDYEYSGFGYRQALYNLAGESAGRLGSVRGYFLRESDLEEDPLSGALTAEERDYLEGLGLAADSLLLPGVRFLGANRGSYALHPDGAGGFRFEYLGPGRGDYAVSFRQAGPYEGSYAFDPSSGGYRYLGPGLGDFEPAGEFSPPSHQDRAGIAFQLRPLSILRLEGEGAVAGKGSGTIGIDYGPARTAHSLRLGLDSLRLPALPLRLSLRAEESLVQQGFGFQGRRYAPDFERRWHLSPGALGSAAASTHGERTAETGLTLHLPAGLEASGDYGRLVRVAGERSTRRELGLQFHPREGLDASWQRALIHSLRSDRDTLPEGGAPAEGFYRRRDRVEARAGLGALTPTFALEREEATGPGALATGGGHRYLELSQGLAARLSPRLETGLTLSGRDTDGREGIAEPEPQSWTPSSSLRAGSAFLRYQGQGSLRLNGRIGHRRNRFSAIGTQVASSTAGRVELLGGNFGGALQSQLVYEISHGSSLRQRVVYLPERHPEEGDYLEDGTYVGRSQGTHRRELLPVELDSRPAASLDLTLRENLDLTRWVDSTGILIRRMTAGTTLGLERESSLEQSWRLYLLDPRALADKGHALARRTRLEADLAVQWAKPEVYSRLELVWNDRLDRRFQQGFEEFGDRALRLQLRVPLAPRLEWDPTAALGKRSRHDLAGRATAVRSLELDSPLILTLSQDWRGRLGLGAAGYRVAGREQGYRRLSTGLGLTRFLAGAGRLEAGLDLHHLSGPSGQDLLLVDLLGAARPGTTLEATAAAGVEAGERMLIHLRYTGRSDYLQRGLVHYGTAEVKYLF